jgi:hypothetical protein
MSQPSEALLAQLARIAYDLRESFSERGHHVEVAAEADSAFGGGTFRSVAMRELAVEVISESASHNGLDFRSVNGLGREFRVFENNCDVRMRFRRAQQLPDGTFLITANEDSSLFVTEPGLLYEEEQWVFAYVPTHEAIITHIFIARILGYEGEGKLGHVVLGHAIHLLGPDAPDRGFIPTDEGLPGFEDQTDEEGEEYGDAS